MPTKHPAPKNKLLYERAQAIVEFAVVLPILMMLLVGILEVGRMIFIYSAVNNASREAARYASAVGLADGGTYNKFQYCSKIREVAKRSAFLTTLADTDIDVNYDKGPATVGTPFDTCPVGLTADPSISIVSGDRVTVTVRATYSPMVNLIPIGSRPFTSVSSRTILGVFQLASDPGGVGSGGAGGSGGSGTPTSTPTHTPTVLASTDTPTATSTATAVAVATLTPTATPVFGCGGVTANSISMATNSKVVTMQITNPHSPFTVTGIQFGWNAATGASGNKTLPLVQAQLGTFVWSGSDSTGSFSSSPAGLTLPGNNTTSMVIFTFDKNYQNQPANATSITINLSSPECGSFSVTKTQ